jgi:hypothetical protein
VPASGWLVALVLAGPPGAAGDDVTSSAAEAGDVGAPGATDEKATGVSTNSSAAQPANTSVDAANAAAAAEGAASLRPEVDAGDDYELIPPDLTPRESREVDGAIRPFYAMESPAETRFALDRRSSLPPLSVAKGRFCFIEDSFCRSAMIFTGDVGVGVNALSGRGGLDLPFTQARISFGATVRPFILAKKQWHPWGVGLVGSWSIASGSILGIEDERVTERDANDSWRIDFVNQAWLSQKRNALHLDFAMGAVNSPVYKSTSGRFWGTHAEVGLGFGGWAGLFLSADFLDQDTRVVFGMKGHGLAAAPIVGLVILGLVAGGASVASVGSGGGG